METKICALCRQARPVGEFQKDPRFRDGYGNRCGPCRDSKDREFLPTCGLKRCTSCMEIKIETECFSFKNKSEGTRVAQCKKCIKLVSDLWYQNNKERHNSRCIGNDRTSGRVIKIRAQRVALMIKLKDRPCSDCGVAYPSWIMQFDHRDGSKKKGNVSRMAYNCASEDSILREAEKCDVVCANCHFDRTHRRRTE